MTDLTSPGPWDSLKQSADLVQFGIWICLYFPIVGLQYLKLKLA